MKAWEDWLFTWEFSDPLSLACELFFMSLFLWLTRFLSEWWAMFCRNYILRTVWPQQLCAHNERKGLAVKAMVLRAGSNNSTTRLGTSGVWRRVVWWTNYGTRRRHIPEAPDVDCAVRTSSRNKPCRHEAPVFSPSICSHCVPSITLRPCTWWRIRIWVIFYMIFAVIHILSLLLLLSLIIIVILTGIESGSDPMAASCCGILQGMYIVWEWG